MNPLPGPFQDPQNPDVFYIVEPAADKSGGYYALTGYHLNLDADTLVITHVEGGPAREWHWTWPGNDVRCANGAGVPITRDACFFDAGGGPHTVYAGSDPAKSDRLTRLGLPVCKHRDWRLAFTWIPADSTPPSPPPAPGPVPPPPAPEPGSVSWGKITWALEATARLLEGEGLTREAAWLLNSDGYIAAKARRG